jgi:hypothetical protein
MRIARLLSLPLAGAVALVAALLIAGGGGASLTGPSTTLSGAITSTTQR